MNIKTVQSKTTYYLTFANRLKVHSILEDKNDLVACVYPRLWDIRGKDALY